VFFTALQCSHGLAMSVCPSFHVSVKRVNCDKMKEISFHILTPYESLMHLVFRHEEWLVGDVPFYLKFFAKLTHPLEKRQLQINIHS